ncbi:MAG: PAS domain-containing protein, partial [Candidatus Limnocylindrales bacterium]
MTSPVRASDPLGPVATDATHPAASLLGPLADAVPHLVWVATGDGSILEVSRRLVDYAAPAGAPGPVSRLELLMHPADSVAAVEAWKAAAAAGTPYEHEHRLHMADGTYRWHLSRAVRVGGPDEAIWYGTSTDIDSRRQAEEALQRTQSALALAMRGGRMGWWRRDLATEIVTWSPELEEIFGLPVGTFAGDEGAFLSFVHPDDRPLIGAAVGNSIETGNDYLVEFRFQRADGTWGWMEGRGRATLEDGRATVLHGLGIDITGRKEDEAAIRAREERLRLAAEAGEFGMYDYDLQTGGNYWSPELLKILGLDEATSAEAAPIHPDDRDEVLRRFLGARDPMSDGAFDFEYRILRSDGARWVATHGQTFFSEPDPEPHRVALRQIGVVFDVTERKQGDELRDVFVGMLSHELRTPVTAIYGGSQMLRREHVDPKVRDEIIAD